jgi:hypothetical protein
MNFSICQNFKNGSTTDFAPGEYLLATAADDYIQVMMNGVGLLNNIKNPTSPLDKLRTTYYGLPIKINAGSTNISLGRWNIQGPSSIAAELIGPFPPGSVIGKTSEQIRQFMYSEGTVPYTNRFGITVQAPKKWVNNIGWSTRNVTSANVENVTHSCPVGYNMVTCPSV